MVTSVEHGGHRLSPLDGPGVKILALETATDLVGAALAGTSQGVVERSHRGGRAHAELLAPAVADVCSLAECALSELDAIAVDIGPGLFTGLRVGVATAKALGQALGIGVLGISSLDVLAAGAIEAVGGQRTHRVVAVVDARRGEVFAAAYDFGSLPTPSGGVDPADVRTDRKEALRPDDLVSWCDGLAGNGPVLIVGDGAVRYLDVLAGRPGLDLDAATAVSVPSPAVLARLATRRLEAGVPTVDAGAVEPDYRRPPDARINWEEREVPRTSAAGGTAT